MNQVKEAGVNTEKEAKVTTKTAYFLREWPGDGAMISGKIGVSHV